MHKVAWLSRHAMTAAQTADLASILGTSPDSLDIEAINITWAASTDRAHDLRENAAKWEELAAAGFAAICGVFPQVALETIGSCELPPVFTAISEARPDLRVGEGPIPFVHLRWSRVLPAPLFLAGLQHVASMRLCSEYDCIMTASGYLREAGF